MSTKNGPSQEGDKEKRCLHLSKSVLQLVHLCVKENISIYGEAQITNDGDMCRAYDYIRKHRKFLTLKNHTDHPVFVNEERICFNGLVLLAEEEVDEVIMAHYGARFGCSTRALHQYLNEIYCKISEARIVKITKASSSRSQMHPVFSNKGPKKTIEAKEIFERVQVDLVDLTRQPVVQEGVEYRYVLVMIDIFSRYMFLRALKNKSSVEVCHHLELICREHGTPKIIQTDQGTEFHGFFDEFCNKRNIRHIRSRAYHPESQGKVERLNRTWKSKMVYDILVNGNINWVANLSLYSETYNQSKHRALGNLTPFFVYFGREAVIKAASNVVMFDEDTEEIYVELDDEDLVSPNILTAAIEAKEKAKQNANKKVQQYNEKQKKIYEKNAASVSYNIGDKVVVKLSGKKFALSKRKNVTRPGVVIGAKPKEFLYFIEYEYNNQKRKDWFFVDNITCTTIQEQEQRLLIATSKSTNNNFHTQHQQKKMKIASEPIQNEEMVVNKIVTYTTTTETCSNYSHKNKPNFVRNDKIFANASIDYPRFQFDNTVSSAQQPIRNNFKHNEKHEEDVSFDLNFGNELKRSKSVDKKHPIEELHKCQLEISHTDPEMFHEIQARQEAEVSKKCILCSPAVPSNGGVVVEGYLKFIFSATCTLDYFLQFIRLAFVTNISFRTFLFTKAQHQDIVAETLLQMEPALYELDWNMARLVWAKMIGIIDHALDGQHRSKPVLYSSKKNMDQSGFKWNMSNHPRIEQNLLTQVYINCFGAEDEFFVNHLSNLLQQYDYVDECDNVHCSNKKQRNRNTFLSFNVKDGKMQHPIITQYDTRLANACKCEISKWLPNMFVPSNATVSYLKQIKIVDNDCDQDESGLYIVCGGQRTSTAPKFTKATYPPMLIISNFETSITTNNVPRRIDIQNQTYLLLGTTMHIDDHFIGMVVCNNHNRDTIVDDVFKTTEGVHPISTAFYIKSE